MAFYSNKSTSAPFACVAVRQRDNRKGRHKYDANKPDT